MSLTLLLALPVILAALVLGASCAGPGSLGVTEGGLSPCPDSPNCVSSQVETGSPQYVAPLGIPRANEGEVSLSEVWTELVALLHSRPRVRVVTVTPEYVHAVFTTPMLRFKDDVEFMLAESEKEIHVRSASRVGHSDLGANRKRVENLRVELARRLSTKESSR